MQIIEIEKRLDYSITDRDNITSAIKEKQIELARIEKDYRTSLYKTLLDLKEKKTATVIINKVAEGILSEKLIEIDIKQAEIRYHKDKLENIRQTIEVLRSLLRNERELSNM